MTYRILIADDSETSRSVIAALLAELRLESAPSTPDPRPVGNPGAAQTGRNSIEVEVVTNGSEALQRLMKLHYDLSLLDVHMPNLTGLQVISHLQTIGVFIPSILMTGHPSRAIEAAAMEAGAIAMLRKPIAAEILRITVQQVLHQRPHPGDGGNPPRP